MAILWGEEDWGAFFWAWTEPYRDYKVASGVEYGYVAQAVGVTGATADSVEAT